MRVSVILSRLHLEDGPRVNLSLLHASRHLNLHLLPVKMSLPVAVGDFIAVGELAYNVYKACKDAGEEYRDLSMLCNHISLVISSCQPADARSVICDQDQYSIKLLSSECSATLTQLQTLLGKYGEPTGLRRIGFLTTKSSRERLRTLLTGQLDIINSFLTGRTLDYQLLTARLLKILFEAREVEGHGKLNLTAMANDPVQLQKFLEELSAGQSDMKQELEKNTEEIKEKLLRGTEDGNGPTGADGKARLLLGPSPAKTDTYNPRSIPWFAPIRKKAFKYVTVKRGLRQEVNLRDVVIHYSPYDEWLCKMHHGRSLTRTLVTRFGRSEEAYYLTYNNLSCQSQFPTQISRLYFTKSPFVPDMDTTDSDSDSSLTMKRDTNGFLIGTTDDDVSCLGRFKVTVSEADAFEDGLMPFQEPVAPKAALPIPTRGGTSLLYSPKCETSIASSDTKLAQRLFRVQPPNFRPSVITNEPRHLLTLRIWTALPT